MKRLFFALTLMTGLLLPLAPRARADSEVSLNFFYDNLSPYGNWIEVADYGYCFQPNVAVGHDNWRPYADGYWAYTDDGWTWVSYEDFGWATYHYGRWTRLADYGWVWVPGYEWGPAWVSWRTGGDYVGWAPLPPAADRVYEGRAITGHVDVEFDIGPRYYNFVDVRYIGEPVLRERIFAPERNVTIINRTVNVTNITYSNSTVYNYGPDYNRLNQYSARPIQRLSLRRETTVGPNFATQGGGRHNFSRVNGNQLVVVAPPIQRSQERLAPRQIKAEVKQPKIEHGWTGISNRQQIQAEMKKENAGKIAAPSFQPQKGRNREAAPAGQNAQTRPNDAPNVSAKQAAKNPKPQPAVAAPKARNAGVAERTQGRLNGPARDQTNARHEKAQRATQQRAAEQRQKAKETTAQSPKKEEHNAQRQEQRAQRAQMQEKNKTRPGDAAQTGPAHKAKAEKHVQQAEQARQPERAAHAQPAEKAKPDTQAQRPERARSNNRARQQQKAERRPDQAPDQGTQPDAQKKRKKKAGNDEKPDQP